MNTVHIDISILIILMNHYAKGILKRHSGIVFSDT